MDQRSYSIIVADPQPIAAEGVRALVKATGDFQFLEGVQSLPAALDAIRRNEPSLLLVDKGFGLLQLLHFFDDLRVAGLNPAIVVWGASVSEAEVLRLVQGGAKGMARKTESLDRLLACLTAVATGALWVTGIHPVGNEAAAPPRLTPRERQVVDLVLQGLRNREIAVELGMRPGTVKVHLKHIFEKTGIRGRYGLALSCLHAKQQETVACG